MSAATAVAITTHPDAGDPLAEAVRAYIEAKQAETKATAARVAAEERILALRPAKEEGSETFEAAGVKVTVTGKLTYSCDDVRALAKACVASSMPANWIPVKAKTELDATGAKWLRTTAPDVWARVVAPHVTIKPAKTSITVKV